MSGTSRRQIRRPGVLSSALGLGSRAVGPGPHCVLRDAAYVGTHGSSCPWVIPLCESFGLWPYFPPRPPFGVTQFGPPGLSPSGHMQRAGFSLLDVLPASGQRVSTAVLGVHGGGSGAPPLSTPLKFCWVGWGARESWTRGGKRGPTLALGLRGTTCPGPVCGPLDPCGGPMPLCF